MKIFMVYMDDGKDCFKVVVPADTEQEARDYVKGNGEVIAAKDVTDEYFISRDEVAGALRCGRLSETEIEVILRCLSINKIVK